MSAAAAIREAIAQRDAGAQSRIVDSYKYAASVVSGVVSNGYIGMVKTIPQMYRFLYARAERATEVGPFRAWVNQYTAANLRTLMLEYQPDAVVCTHAFPCGAMAEYKRQFADAPPVVGVVTDFCVHSFWIHTNVDGYVVATEESAAALINRGVDRHRVRLAGIPVAAPFAQSAGREDLRARLGLPAQSFTILLMGGGLGIGPLEMMMEALEHVGEPISAVVIAGRNKRMQARILATAERMSYPVRVLNFIDNVHDYMHASDLLLSKPGGLTAAEALVSGLPMVLVKPLPGQEERNTRYLVERKVALRARNAAHLVRIVKGLYRSPERVAAMRQAALALGRPGAADESAQMILNVARMQSERNHHAAVI